MRPVGLSLAFRGWSHLNVSIIKIKANYNISTDDDLSRIMIPNAPKSSLYGLLRCDGVLLTQALVDPQKAFHNRCGADGRNQGID